MKSGMILTGYDKSNHFILTRPAKISDIIRGDLPYETDDHWKEKARQLRIRRLKRLKHLEEI